MKLPNVLFAALCVTLSFATGCGGDSGRPKTYKTSGSVKVNGKPIEGAVVTFQLSGGKENAIGSTDANGEFTLSMFVPGDGAVEGQYNVAISKHTTPPPPQNSAGAPGVIASGELSEDYAPPAATASGGADKGPKSPIPEKYSNDQTSGLRASVTPAGPNRFDFDLK
ncbi:hypothetical protein VN12_23755 [Pirellula sp. SH-Sr6A]|uniref:carboxypeptidase regulatory-like domain-containing protein n=1 Tax=Pirellula sp. SH-Sr6A TaxID=1632865 RepID=UPI00078D8402|nr:carboxypeptidase regulatory-like domain-containing protein [Pirellula sp. SH-Sr6A]AMV35162.1 hypothetical protein VN12_23755 [Pirellula sp. SH-Sr6A]